MFSINMLSWSVYITPFLKVAKMLKSKAERGENFKFKPLPITYIGILKWQSRTFTSLSLSPLPNFSQPITRKGTRTFFWFPVPIFPFLRFWQHRFYSWMQNILSLWHWFCYCNEHTSNKTISQVVKLIISAKG